MKLFMVLAAKRLQCAKPELHRIAVVILDVVHDVGRYGATFGFAQFAERVACEMVAPSFAPAAVVVWTAAIVTAASRIQRMGSAHGELYI